MLAMKYTALVTVATLALTFGLSGRVGAMRQMWTSGLVPSSLLPATKLPLNAFRRGFYRNL